MTEGAITKEAYSSTYQYEYALRDHLGNTRVTFKDKNNDASIDYTNADPTIKEITQINHYYPFGLNMEGNWNANGANKYQYNGKEWNNDFGLGLFDYGFRMYDPAIGRFPMVDPLAEIYKNQNPYTYAANNPVSLIDFMGLGPKDPDPNYDPAKDPTVHEENTYTVTANRILDRNLYPQAYAWQMWVENSFDIRMAMTPNQYENPYKTDKERQGDRDEAQLVSETADDIGEIFATILETAFTLGTNQLATPGKYVFKQGVKRQIMKKVAFKALNSTINITQKGLKHALDRHTFNMIAKFAGKSKFLDASKVEALIKQATQMPMIEQANGNFARIVNAGYNIGVDRVTGNPTSIYSVITNALGELVTAFPGLPY